MENMEDEKDKDVLIFDTRGGWNVTITKRACCVFEFRNHQQKLCG